MSFFNRLTSITKDIKSSKELAEHIGVSPSTISHWKLGQEPNAATIRQIAKVLNVDPGWLLFGDQKEGS